MMDHDVEESVIVNPSHQTGGWYDSVPSEVARIIADMTDQKFVEYLSSISNDEKLNLLRSERARWRTFRSYWRMDSPVLAKSLVKCGFYSLNIGDEVHCIFCGESFMEWNSGATPMDKHRDVSPNCSFVQGSEKPPNIPFTNWSLPVTREEDLEAMTSNTDAVASIPIPEFSDEAIAEMICDPRYPKYRSHQDRLQSFEGREENFEIDTQRLADAGMFYSGFNYDNTIQCTCFCCAGSFTLWEADDDPWMEHARFYPKCPFLVDAMGVGYVQSIAAQMNPIEIDKHAQTEYSGFDNRIMCCMCNRRQAKAFFEPCGRSCGRQICEICYETGNTPINPSRCLKCNEVIQDIILMVSPMDGED